MSRQFNEKREFNFMQMSINRIWSYPTTGTDQLPTNQQPETYWITMFD